MASKPVSAMALSPMPQGKTRLSKVMGGAGAAALLIASVAAFEGKRNDPYKDIIGTFTVCYGETHVAMHHYSDAQCEDMLANSLADFAEPVEKRNPELIGHPYQLAAATSLAYNTGTANYRKSSVARLFSAGKWRQACDAFLAWRFAGRPPREVPGLLRRRKDERKMCLSNLP